MMMQITKIDWIHLWGGNNALFHAYLKTKQNYKCMRMLQKVDGTEIEALRSGS